MVFIGSYGLRELAEGFQVTLRTDTLLSFTRLGDIGFVNYKQLPNQIFVKITDFYFVSDTLKFISC